jgi:hypothetical protein
MWRLWLGDPAKLKSLDDMKVWANSVNIVLFSVLSYGTPCPEIQKITQDTSEVAMDIAKILENLSLLLRGRKLSVVLEDKIWTIYFDPENKVLRREIPAIIVEDDGTVKPAFHSVDVQEMTFGAIITVLSSGVRQ